MTRQEKKELKHRISNAIASAISTIPGVEVYGHTGGDDFVNFKTSDLDRRIYFTISIKEQT